MNDSLACPICTMTELLESADKHECVTCGHEWPKALLSDEEEGVPVVRDSNGNILCDGDAVTVIKDLKAGTKIKGIRLVDGDHDVDCKVDGMGVMLKSKFLKKA